MKRPRFTDSPITAIQKPEIVNRFATLGALPMDLESEKFQTFIEQDVTRWKEFLENNPKLTSE